MAGRYRGRDARALDVPPPNKQSGPRTASNASGSIREPNLGERIEYECPTCDHEADATYRVDRVLGKPRWFVGSAFTTACPGGKECLNRHREWLGELGINVTSVELVTDPRPALIAAGAEGRRTAKPRRLPSSGFVDGWHSALFSHAPALDYLLGRGISLEIVAQCQIGWDSRRLTFPMYDAAGELVAFKTREPRDGAQMRCWPGRDRAWPLYPGVPAKAEWVLLAAGELDALRGLSAGLPAVSVTLGAGTWQLHWTDELRGLRVVVCFDNNERELAERRVVKLRAAEIRASLLDLRRLGLAEPKGDLSDYLNAGGDPGRVKPPGRRPA